MVVYVISVLPPKEQSGSWNMKFYISIPLSISVCLYVYVDNRQPTEQWELQGQDWTVGNPV